jgi:hypothetical protein
MFAHALDNALCHFFLNVALPLKIPAPPKLVAFLEAFLLRLVDMQCDFPHSPECHPATHFASPSSQTCFYRGIVVGVEE